MIYYIFKACKKYSVCDFNCFVPIMFEKLRKQVEFDYIETDPYQETAEWLDQINNNIVPYLYRHLKAYVEGKECDEPEQKLFAGLPVFSEAIDRKGPYFSGENVTAVDFSFIPFAYRTNLLLGSCGS